MRGAGVCGKSQPGVWVYRERVAPPLRYESPLTWPWFRVWMGASGLQGRGGRPQGRSCLLLAVAGATSLVTLLLAVPITVLAVLALVHQEQGGPVSGCNRP